jgi:CelD/BcsL family acetyltransferase involved in cellulose biosynthesis
MAVASCFAEMNDATATVERDLRMVVEPLPPLDALERMWRALDQTGAHSFYLSWTWIGTWLRALPHVTAPRLLRAMRGSKTRALALLVRRKAKLGGILPVSQVWLNATGDPALDCTMIEHNGFASAASWGDELYRALVRWFATQCNDADELVLPGIDSGWPPNVDDDVFRIDRRSPAYRTPLRSVAAEGGIEPLLSRNARQQLRRSMRACEREGSLSLDVARDTKTAMDYF